MDIKIITTADLRDRIVYGINMRDMYYIGKSILYTMEIDNDIITDNLVQSMLRYCVDNSPEIIVDVYLLFYKCQLITDKIQTHIESHINSTMTCTWESITDAVDMYNHKKENGDGTTYQTVQRIHPLRRLYISIINWIFCE